MAVRLQDVKYVDDKSQKLLGGYLRNIYGDKAEKDHIIPDLVLNICLLFYFRREHFAVIVNGWKGKVNFTLSNDDKTASLVNGCYGNVYGNIKIDSLSEAVYKWTIKVENKKTKNWAQYIELGVSGDEPGDKYFYGNTAPKNTFMCKGTGYVHGKCRVQEYFANVRWKDGDIVGIKLDLKKKDIEYFVNDKSVGVLYEDIPVGQDIKYRCIVYINHDGGCATIEHFERL